MNNKNKSFTLIELLVVIVIIGILAGVIMISTSSSIDKANMTKIKAFSEVTKNSMLLNLVSDWSFDNLSAIIDQPLSSDVFINDVWGTNNGTAVNGPILKNGVNCIEGQCLKFTGNQSVTIPSNSSFNVDNEVTLESWFYVDQYSNTGISTFLGSPSSFYFWQYSYNSSPSCFVWEIYNGGTRRHFDLPLSLIPLKQWIYLTLIYKNRNLIIYKNGMYYNLKSVGEVDIPQSNHSFQIGNINYYGSIDSVRYYNAALSYSQVKQNYIAGLNSMLASGNISKEEYNERINNLAYNDNNE